ncbi:zinc finger BED domain-containing protein 4 [Denticeps clupeoides]|nr:zinc finger BED domain-containing protein 4-like [Denticeps clupeoides]
MSDGRRGRRVGSRVWKYFYIKDRSHVCCTICKAELNWHNSTTSMLQHLKRKHGRPEPAAARVDTFESFLNSLEHLAAAECSPETRSTEEGDDAECFTPSSQRRTSKVWKFYKQLTETSVMCIFCKKKLAFNNSTTSMREHLIRLHKVSNNTLTSASVPPLPGNTPDGETALQPAAVCVKEEPNDGAISSEGVEPKYVQSTEVDEIVMDNHAVTEAGSKKTASSVTDLVLGMVTCDLQPLTVVEERGFGLMLRSLEPSYVPPSPGQLGSLIWQRYSGCKKHLQLHLRASLASRSLALCAESWSSYAAAGQTYLTVSGSFIDRNWRLVRCCLATQPLPDPSCTGRILTAALSDFGLPETLVSCVVRDTADAPDGPPLPEGWAELRCVAAALQQCIGSALASEPVRQTLAEVRRIASSPRQDSGAANKAGPQPDDPARWLTTMHMCESLLELGPVPACELAEPQRSLLKELALVLKTVYIAASFLSEGVNGPMSALMPSLQGVYRLLEQQMAKSSCAFAQTTVKGILSRMEMLWSLGDEEALVESTAVLASFLDPRFKELRFLSPQARQKLHGKVKELLSAQAHREGEEFGKERDVMEVGFDDPLSLDSPPRCGSPGDDGIVGQNSKPENSAPPPSPQSPACQNMYDVLLGEDPTERMPEIHQQLENYIAEPLCKRSLSPLHWWYSMEHRFPAVSRLARRYLAIPATVVPTERAFAARESTASQRRAVLGARHLDHILFLHQNKEYVEQLKRGSVWT